MNLTQAKHALGLGLIIGGNLIPFYGIYAWGWDIFSIFFLYWAENAIIGIYMILTMLIVAVRNGILEVIGSLFLIPFFIVHYGMFCMGHLAILTGLFGPEELKGQLFGPEDFVGFISNTNIQGFYIAFLGIAVAQAFVFFDLFLREFKNAASPGELMMRPYGRIVVLHLAILLGGFAALGLGSPVWALAVLIGLKTLYDVGVLKFSTDDKTQSKVPHEKPPEGPEVTRLKLAILRFIEKRTGRKIPDRRL